jgi:hypothetical protein
MATTVIISHFSPVQQPVQPRRCVPGRFRAPSRQARVPCPPWLDSRFPHPSTFGRHRSSTCYSTPAPSPGMRRCRNRPDPLSWRMCSSPPRLVVLCEEHLLCSRWMIMVTVSRLNCRMTVVVRFVEHREKLTLRPPSSSWLLRGAPTRRLAPTLAVRPGRQPANSRF